jgi:indole-3-glycerol phosphate synthase
MSEIPDVLVKICDDKRAFMEERKKTLDVYDLLELAGEQTPPRGFAAALTRGARMHGTSLIAEIKKASPSKGLIRPDFDPPSLAQAYKAGGATCLSVLTDEPYFQGHDDYLKAVRAAVDLPLLRKDFMLDAYQIAESRAIGADCVLIIMAALDDETALHLEAATFELGMDAILEVHNEEEFERAMKLESPLIGVNNRNLKTLEIDIGTTERLAEMMPYDKWLISESGLYSNEDLVRMRTAGAKSFLIGESLMRQDDVAAATKAILARED